jgi:hypothetical protein
MRNKVMTARPAARKGSGTQAAKKTVAVASRRSQPIIQMVERKSSPNITALPKKSGELPIPTATFVF